MQPVALLLRRAYGPTKDLLTVLDEAAGRSGVSRGQAFEDFLHMGVCALSGGALEEQYLAVVENHVSGERGKRGCDKLAELFGRMVDIMEDTRQDVLGDLFQGAITYGEAGQYLTPETIASLMATMSIGDEDERRDRRTVCDPCVGSGRMLLALAEHCPHWEFIGQDVDLRCVRMTTINLALRNRYGYAIWGNSLGNEQRLVYRTGFNGRGFVREVSPAKHEEPVRKMEVAAQPTAKSPSPTGPFKQLRFF